MKWISVIAFVVILCSFVMIYEGSVANSMKAENREGLILYGILACALSGVWLAVHGLIFFYRKGLHDKPLEQS